MWAMMLGLVLAGEPAPAPRPVPDGRLVVAGREGAVRLLSPDGAEVGRLAAANVPTADGKLAPAGRVRADGAIPVRTGVGLGLLTVGRGATLRPFADRGEAVLAWSPDGKRAVVRLPGKPPAYQILDAGGPATPVTLPAGHTPHDWAADGWFLTTTAEIPGLLGAVFGGRAKYNVWRTWADGRPPERLAPEGVEAVHPRLSPDGRRVVYFTNHITYADIWTLNLSTGERVRVTGVGNSADPLEYPTDLRLAWSPDGKRLAYSWQYPRVTQLSAAGVEKFDGRAFLRVCDADGGNARELPADDPAEPVALIDWR